MDENDLSSILSDEPTSEASESEAPQTAEAERARDPATGKFVSASDPGDEHQEAAQQPPTEAAPPAAQQDAEQGHIPVAALRDERQKRQQLEQQLQQYEQYFTQLQQQQPQQQPEVPDPYVDLAGYTQWVAQQSEQRVLPSVQEYVAQAIRDVQLGNLEERARAKYPDYEEKAKAFYELKDINPQVIQAALAADNPFEYGYRAATQFMQAKALGNAPSRDAIKDEIRAEILAELGMSTSKPTAPSSLASERSVGTRSGPVWSGPPTLNELLG